MPDNAISALKALIAEEKPKRILELGYGTGKSRQAIDDVCDAEVISLEQDKKLIKGGPAVWAPIKRIYEADMLCPIVRYKEYPDGPWDMIVIDGPANPAPEPWVGGDIFHVREDLKVGGVVFVQGRKLHVDYYQANLPEEFIFERIFNPSLAVMRKR
jgi:predicted O-methyltransferase YrrM